MESRSRARQCSTPIASCPRHIGAETQSQWAQSTRPRRFVCHTWPPSSSSSGGISWRMFPTNVWSGKVNTFAPTLALVRTDKTTAQAARRWAQSPICEPLLWSWLGCQAWDCSPSRLIKAMVWQRRLVLPSTSSARPSRKRGLSPGKSLGRPLVWYSTGRKRMRRGRRKPYAPSSRTSCLYRGQCKIIYKKSTRPPDGGRVSFLAK